MNVLKGKLLIGITGGIGSGKSEVCRRLEKNGYAVFYADPIAKELYFQDKKLANSIVKEFGKCVLDSDGKIDLVQLKNVVFKSKNNFHKINNIVHPVVIDYIFKEAKKSSNRIVLIEAALIFESSFDKQLDYIIMVYSNKENRIRRIMQRDGAKRKDIENIMKFQIDDREKVKKADFIIFNNDTLSGLDSQVKFISNVIKTLKKPLTIN